MFPQARALNPPWIQPTPAVSRPQDGQWAFLCFVAAIMLGALALTLSYMVEGRWAFMVAIMMTLALDGCLWFGVIKNDHRCFALKFAFVGFMLAKLFPIGACLSLGLDEDYLFPGGEFVMGAPFTAALAGNILNFSIAVIFLVTRPFFRPHGYDIPIRKMFWHTSPRFELFLIFAGVVNLLWWVSITVLDNPLFYFIRILASTIMAVPFFVGLTAFKYKKALVFWLAVMALQLIISFLTGTRGAAFVPIGFFLVGFVVGLPNWRLRLTWGIPILGPVAVLIAAAGTFIGAARDVTGRTDLLEALAQGTMLQAMDETVVAANITYRGNAAFEVFRRMTVWPEYVVPPMTPNPVPYRGFADFTHELRSAFGLGIFALIDPNFRGNFYFGNIFLREYGFGVHVDAAGRRTSNVNLPIQVDAFMRGGWITAFAFTLFGCMVIFVVERILRIKLLPRLQPVFLLMLMFLCYIVYIRFRSASLVDSMRQLVLEGVFCFIVFYAFDRVLKMMGKVDAHR